MLELLNTIVVSGYAVLCVLLFNHGTCPDEPLRRRVKFAALATAFMCFGFGRFGYDVAVNSMTWVFFLGHFAFQVFGALYFWNGFETVKGKR